MVLCCMFWGGRSVWSPRNRGTCNATVLILGGRLELLGRVDDRLGLVVVGVVLGVVAGVVHRPLGRDRPRSAAGTGH